jgi:hypothetical protein
MRIAGAADGHLVVFNRRPDADPNAKVFRSQEGPITVWGM